MDTIVDFETAAKLLGCTPRALRGWVAVRKIDYIKSGKFVKFRQSVIDAFLETNTVKALPKKGVSGVGEAGRKKVA